MIQPINNFHAELMSQTAPWEIAQQKRRTTERMSGGPQIRSIDQLTDRRSHPAESVLLRENGFHSLLLLGACHSSERKSNSGFSDTDVGFRSLFFIEKAMHFPLCHRCLGSRLSSADGSSCRQPSQRRWPRCR